MNDDQFGMSVRMFLKKVGITSQREIETAVRAAIDSGRLQGNEKLAASMHLTERLPSNDIALMLRIRQIL